jgi:hypothetical protein
MSSGSSYIQINAQTAGNTVLSLTQPAGLDDPMQIPPPNFLPPPPYSIPSLENFNSFDQSFRSMAGERGYGYTNGVPEPASLALLAGGLVAIGCIRRCSRPPFIRDPA